MKIAKVRIENFRAFQHVTIDFGDYTCFVGPNGSGKSTVLAALRVFFRDVSGSSVDLINLEEEDFYMRDTSNSIEITVTFSDLEEEAQKDLAHYYRQGLLVVSAIASWDPARRAATVGQYGQRLVMSAFKEFFEAEAEGASVADLKQTYNRIRTSYPDLPQPGAKAATIKALRTYEEHHPELCELTPSQDQFYGFSRGVNRLEKYVQWVFIPAVKDASEEQLEARNTALGTLLERTVRSKLSFKEPLSQLRTEVEEKYQKLLEESQHGLESLSQSLDKRLKNWAHPGASLKLKWHAEMSKYVSLSEPLARIEASEGPFHGALPRFGHGLQRSFLMALLQELSGSTDTGGPRLVLGCEEPELYQHPPQARHLAAVLQTLSKQNAQIIISTHTPYFVRGQSFEDVRLFRLDPRKCQPTVHRAGLDNLARRIAAARGDVPLAPAGVTVKVEQALQPHLSEMFFSPVLVLVEGLEDMAYVATYVTLMERWDDFRQHGCHIVPTYSKSKMVLPLAIAKELKIPTFVVFDSDGHKPDTNGSRIMHEKDNRAILTLCGLEKPDPFPSKTLRAHNLTMWHSEISEVVRNEIGQKEWRECEERVRRKYDIDVGDLHKNHLFIGYVLTEAWEYGKRSPSLGELCNDIIAYAASGTGS